MTKLDKVATSEDRTDVSEDVHVLAARALAVLAEHRVPQPPRLAERIHMLAGKACSADAEDLRQAIERVLGDGVSADDVIDHVLPAIARRLGELWFADDISFVDVSIGTARLQETVRLLRARERGRPRGAGRDARVLLIIPGPEEHTLGAIIAADQLRRRGVMVDLSVAERRTEIAGRIRGAHYHMIGITASGIRTVASVKELVDTIRRSTKQFVPVVLGGALCEADDQLKDRVSVDIMTTDICAAARRCGLLPTETAVSEALDR